MKYALLLGFLIPSWIFSQNNFFSTVSGGYMLNGKVQYVEGLVELDNKYSSSISIGFDSESFYGLELEYTGVYNNQLEFTAYSFSNLEDFSTNVNIHNISINYNNYFQNSSIFTPYLNLGVGTSIFDVRKEDVKDPVRFALYFGGGSNIKITNWLSARIRARYFAPMVFEGAGIHAGIGFGTSSAGLSIEADAPLAQLNIDAGLIFRLTTY